MLKMKTQKAPPDIDTISIYVEMLVFRACTQNLYFYAKCRFGKSSYYDTVLFFENNNNISVVAKHIKCLDAHLAPSDCSLSGASHRQHSFIL